MGDDVVVGFGADAKRFEQESDKVQARLARLESQNQSMANKSKAGAEQNAMAFVKWGAGIAGITSAASIASTVLSTMVDRAKEIRAIQDAIAVKTELNQKPVFKELRVFTPEGQKQLSEKMRQAQADTGASPEIVSGVYSDLGQNGNKLADVLEGKFDSILKLAVVSGEKSSGSLVDTINASFVREKNSNPTEQQIQKRVELLGTLGKDLNEATQLIAKLSPKITTEKGIAYYEALKDRYGTGREANKHLTGKETESQILKLANESREGFQERLERNRKYAASDFEGKFNIEKGSIAYNANKLDVNDQKYFGGGKVTREQEEKFNRAFNEKYFKDETLINIGMAITKQIASMFTADEMKQQNYADPGVLLSDKNGKRISSYELRQREYAEFFQTEARKNSNELGNKSIQKNEDSKVNTK